MKKTAGFYAVEVSYRDSWTDGKWVTQEYRGNARGRSVNQFLDSYGFNEEAKKNDPAFEWKVGKVREFDNIGQYMDASIDDFKTYDRRKRVEEAESRFGKDTELENENEVSL